MGVEPFLLASSLEAIMGQRLLRKICSHCKEVYHPDEALLKSLNGSTEIPKNVSLYHGRGCSHCNQTGMTGRIGMFELLRITSPLRDLIATRPTTDQLLRVAPQDYEDMVHDGINKIQKGLTTPEEVFRVAKTISDEA
jgi:type II secretory ATPase GspE/PulE/Tfp pilus assembly ATPase PilB-like protein